MKLTKLNLVLLALLALVTTADILLLRQNQLLRRASKVEGPNKPEIGSTLRSYLTQDIDGKPVQLGNTGSGPKRVYLYFTASCKFCREQFPYWKSILSQAPRHNLEVIGLVKENEDQKALRSFLEEMSCGPGSATPIRVAIIPKDLQQEYKLTATPITLIANNQGVIERSSVGVWLADEFPEVNSAFDFVVNSRY